MQKQKLTKKDFIKMLPGSKFCAAIWNKTDQEIQEELKKHDYNNTAYIYKVKEIKERSNFVDCIKEDNTSSRRDFNGNNDFYLFNGFLIHKNYKKDYNVFMINALKGE